MDRTPSDSPDLTPRQREVLDLIVRERRSNAEIAERLGISVQGVKWHVRELLDRYDAANREELIARVQGQRAPRARIRRLAAGLIGLLPAKAAAGVGAAAVLAGVATTALVVVARSSDGAEPEAPALAAETPAAVPSLTPVAGAIWTPQEAMDYARILGAQPMLDNDVGQRFPKRIDVLTMTPGGGRWLPGITRFDHPDGDHYWESENGVPRNAWYFTWTLGNADTVQDGPGYLQVDVLIIDGDRGAAAGTVLTLTVGNGQASGGSHGEFHSRSMDLAMDNLTRQVGPEVDVAWLNNVVGGASLAAYPTAGGGWCSIGHAAPGEPEVFGTGCPYPARGPNPDLYFSREVNNIPGLAISTHDILRVTTSERVRRLVIEHPDGRRLTFETVPIPAAIGVAGRTAFLDVGVGWDGYVVVGLDASGAEVTREAAGPLPPAQGVPLAIGRPTPDEVRAYYRAVAACLQARGVAVVDEPTFHEIIVATQDLADRSILPECASP